MLKRINLTGNPNLGVYVSVNDDIAIAPFNLPEVMESNLEEALNVKVIRTSIAGSNLVGALTVGNSNGFIVSPYANNREIKVLEDEGLNVAKMPGKYTAVGNIMAVNDHGAIVSPDIEEEAIDVLEDTLKVPVKLSPIAGFNIIGSLAVVTNKGALVHRDTIPTEMDFIEDIFKVQGDIGTVGKGISLVGACSIANSYGVIVSEGTTGPEMARVEEALGFLDFED